MNNVRESNGGSVGCIPSKGFEYQFDVLNGGIDGGSSDNGGHTATEVLLS